MEKKDKIQCEEVTNSVVKKREPVVEITDENKWRTIRELGGMIKNDDNTYSATPQSITWTRNQRIQLKDTYDTRPKKGIAIAALVWHPEPTDLKLYWSYEGYWILIPLRQGQTGPRFNSKDCRVARVEQYIDIDGVVKKAICYGIEEFKLDTWYDMEEIIQAFPDWKHEESTEFYNTRRFSWQVKRSNSEETPGDQPIDGIQGEGYPRGRGRGYSRGRGQYRSRGRSGRSRPYYYGRGGRPSERDDAWYEEYEEWDEGQVSDPRYMRDNDDRDRRSRREPEQMDDHDTRYNRQEKTYTRDRKRSNSRGRSISRESHSRVRPESRRRSGSRVRSSSPRRQYDNSRRQDSHRRQDEDRDRNSHKKSIETYERDSQEGSRRGSVETTRYSSRGYEDRERRRDEDRKRARSPSPRRGRYRENSPDYEYDRRGRRGRRSNTPETRYRGKDLSSNK